MRQKTVIQNRHVLKVSKIPALSRKVPSRLAGVFVGGPQVWSLRPPFLCPTFSLPQHVISNNLDHMGTLDGHFDNGIDFAGSEGYGMEVDHSETSCRFQHDKNDIHFVPLELDEKVANCTFTVIHEHIGSLKSLYTLPPKFMQSVFCSGAFISMCSPGGIITFLIYSFFPAV